MYITDIKVNDGHQLTSPFVIRIMWDIFREYPSLKPHILFYSNGLAIDTVFPIPPILKSIMASGRLFEFDRVDILQRISLTETAHFVL